ncbi:trypsin-like serine protease [Neoconidiobolus thromboides FSU 785]|nr:trypsin-like serine protease [Neoconidiobolus thromboides FSU 785]
MLFNVLWVLGGFIKLFTYKKCKWRIVGGTEVSPKFSYPWLVTLKLSTWIVCGGTLINSNTVITAAHCMIAENENWTVLVHRHNITLPSAEENGAEYKVVNRTMHPKYIDSPTGFDISIWKVEPSKKLDIDFSVLKFDTEGIYKKENQLLKVAGWGTIAKSGAYSPVLLETKLPVFNFDKCKSIYKQLDSSEFCAGYVEGTKDTCQGDSGGPVFITAKGKVTLVGIISRGEGCAKVGYPGVYTSIAEVRDFIDQNI